MSDMDLATRVARLEERLSWFERHAVEQDKAMLELVDEVAKLRQEVRRLRDSVSQSPTGGDSLLQNERPPHY